MIVNKNTIDNTIKRLADLENKVDSLKSIVNLKVDTVLSAKLKLNDYVKELFTLTYELDSSKRGS